MNDLMKIIDDNQSITYDQSFSLSIKCARLLANNNEHDEMLARQIAIHILNSWDRIPESTYSIWNDIIEIQQETKYNKPPAVVLKQSII